MRAWRRGAVMMVAAAELFSMCPEADAAAGNIPASACVKDLEPATLTAFFKSGATGLLGGDYPRSYPIGDGRVLWLFQDAFIGAPSTRTLTAAGFAHNAALVQDGLCFRLLWGGGRSSSPTSFLHGTNEKDLSHWWWPLDGEMGADGNLHVFAAEFVNKRGAGAAPGATPVAVWHAVVRPGDLRLLSFTPAPDRRDRPLYGWAIASDDEWSYLYSNCYRQFTTPGYIGDFDLGCTRDVTVGRVPRGHFEQQPTYWNGAAWGSVRASAAVVHRDGVLSNPLQVERFAKDLYVGVALLDDWFGTTVVSYRSSSPTGPFQRYAATPVAKNCGAACNVYFAAFTPWRARGGGFEVAISNFTWDVAVAFRTPALYRPSVVVTPAPSELVPVTFQKDGTMQITALPPGATGVAAVALGVDVPSPRASGSLVLWPCGQPQQRGTSVTVTRGVPATALVMVALGQRGMVCAAASSDLEFVVTRRGWVSAGAGFAAVSPARVLDTRPTGRTVDGKGQGGGAVRAGATIQVPVTGRGGVPVTASTVVVTVSGVATRAVGTVSVGDCGAADRPEVLALAVGTAVSNTAVVTVAGGRRVCVTPSVDAQLMVDVAASWTGPPGLATVPTRRLLDTTSAADLAASTTTEVQVIGQGASIGTRSVLLSLSTWGGTGSGSVDVRSCDEPASATAPAGARGGLRTTRAVLVALSAAGTVCVDVVGGSTGASLDLLRQSDGRGVHVEPGAVLVDTAA